jgi:hypothetical protein
LRRLRQKLLLLVVWPYQILTSYLNRLWCFWSRNWCCSQSRILPYCFLQLKIDRSTTLIFHLWYWTICCGSDLQHCWH